MNAEDVPATGWTTSRSGAARLSDDEVLARLVETARREFRDVGLEVSINHLSLESLIQAAGVPRTRVFRAWGDKAGVYAKILSGLATSEHGFAFDPGTLTVAHDVIEGHPDLLATAAGRRALLEEAVRVGAMRNFSTIRALPSWRTFMSLLSTVDSLDEQGRSTVLGELAASESHFVDAMSQFYVEMMHTLQMRLKPDCTAESIAILGSAVVEGLAHRARVAPEAATRVVLRPGVDGNDVEWSLAAIGFLAVIDALVEPVSSDRGLAAGE